MKAQPHIPPPRTACTPQLEASLQQAPVSPYPATVTGLDEMPSRRLLLLERTMYRDGYTPFTSLFTVRVRGDLNETRLRQALAQMQAKHPLLRCVVEENAEGPRFVLRSRPAPVPLRIAERSTDFAWEEEARREWITPFRSTQEPLVRLVWLRGDGVHECMLVAHHCICDGPSGMILLRDCFAAYDDPRAEAGAYDALGAIEDLVPEALLRSRSFRFRVRRRTALLRLALLVRAPRRHEERRLCADQIYFHRWQLDPADARPLIERCREENVTILAAAGVAFQQAFREIRGAGALKNAYTMVNARRFMPRLHPEALFGIAPGVAIPMPKLSSAEGISNSAFWENARAIRKNLAVRIDRLGKQFYEYLAALENLHDRYARLVADTDAAPAIRHVTFSNLGRLDLPQHFRSFHIEHVYSPLVMVSPSPANTVILSSFGGAMEFAIISDERSLPQTQARAIRERAMSILRASAAIGLQDGSGQEQERWAQRETTI